MQFVSETPLQNHSLLAASPGLRSPDLRSPGLRHCSPGAFVQPLHSATVMTLESSILQTPPSDLRSPDLRHCSPGVAGTVQKFHEKLDELLAQRAGCSIADSFEDSEVLSRTPASPPLRTRVEHDTHPAISSPLPFHRKNSFLSFVSRGSFSKNKSFSSSEGWFNFGKGGEQESSSQVNNGLHLANKTTEEEVDEDMERVECRGLEAAFVYCVICNLLQGEYVELLDLLQERYWQELEPRWLEISLKSASNLPAMDDNGLSDPWVQFSLVNMVENKEHLICRDGLRPWNDPLRGCYVGLDAKVESRVRSKTVNKSLNPEWNQDLDLELTTGYLNSEGQFCNEACAYHVLVGWVYDADYLGNELIGIFQIPVAALMDGRSHFFVCQLADAKDLSQSAQGQVKLTVKLSQ
mmetsp:Transcript_18824/g.29402  ORF Transcript_18824/g.29402 Transcript_18824/m.29402 type:complete len:408 (+) Transcript_18824:185-1408(+)